MSRERPTGDNPRTQAYSRCIECDNLFPPTGELNLPKVSWLRCSAFCHCSQYKSPCWLKDYWKVSESEVP